MARHEDRRGAHGPPPAFDRIAREGGRFTYAFCASPSCTPSRSAVRTGRHLGQIGKAGVLSGTLPQKFPVFPHLLPAAGYHTGFTPKGRGPGEWPAGGLARHPLGREKRLADVTVPPDWPDTAEVRRDLLDYALEIDWFDAQLAKIIAQLETLGELDHTLVVVTSDNGMPLPRAKTIRCDPGVRMPFAVRWPGRIPAGRVVDDFVRHLDFAPTFLEAAGAAGPAAFTGRSLLPVLTSRAAGRVDPTRDAAHTALERHTWCRADGGGYPMRALRTADFLYIRNFAPDRWPTRGPDFISSNKTFHGDGAPIKAFMEAPVNQRRFPVPFALCYGKRPLEELYAVRADPHQINHLATDPAHRATREKLWPQLRAYLVQTGDPRIAGCDPWPAYPHRQTVGFGATFNRTLSDAARDAAAGRGSGRPQTPVKPARPPARTRQSKGLSRFLFPLVHDSAQLPAMKNLMEDSMRWFGPNDTVSLAEIRQTGATAVFSALHSIPYGEAWPAELIAQHRDTIAAAGLTWRVAESVPVSEAIKTRSGDFARHIETYKITLQRLGAAGIEVVVYNFMPVLDWVRTDLAHRLPDGTEALLYDPKKFAAFDLFGLARPGAAHDFTPAQRAAAADYWTALDDAGRAAFIRQTLDLFPGVRLNLSLDDFRRMLARYADIDAARLTDHLRLFLAEIVPVAEAAGVRLAVHPDDPPFPILGLPRIVSTEEQLRAILALVDSPANGLCYCTGSLSVRADNDLAGIVRRLGPRIHAVHLRAVQREPDGTFYEANHLEGSMDMAAVVRALLEEQAARRRAGRRDWQVALRPDHGHRMLDDFKRPDPTCPGYPLIGRLRGLAELRGLQVGLSSILPTA